MVIRCQADIDQAQPKLHAASMRAKAWMLWQKCDSRYIHMILWEYCLTRLQRCNW